MSIESYFWLVMGVIAALALGISAIGYTVGRRASGKGAGVGIGLAILIIMAALVGGAKAAEKQFGDLLTYEASWLASTWNFALAGGYLFGRSGRSGRKPVVPALCGALALISIGMVIPRMHALVEQMKALGVGENHAKPAGPNTSLDCKASLQKIYAGFQHYVEVDDALPPAAKWMDEEDLRSGIQADEWFHCPTVSNRKDDKYGYAYNDAVAGRKLNGKKLEEMPDAGKTPLVYDSSILSKNAHDTMTSLPRPGRHGGRNNILYCDGHIDTAPPQ